MPPKTIPLISDTRRAQAGLVLAVEVVVIDLLSKWAVFTFVLNDAVTKTITPFFNLVIVWNRGVTFGLLGDVTIQHQAYILSGVGLLVVVALGVWLFKTSSALQALALGLVMGGALGNIYDRIIYGAVRDFLDFHAFGYHWPAFNFADSAIVMGALLLAYQSLTQKPPPAPR